MPELAVLFLESRRLGQHVGQTAGAPRSPDQQYQTTTEQQRRRPRFEILNPFDAFQNDENLNTPKQEERDPRVNRYTEDRGRKRSVPGREHHSEECVERCAADPRLNPEPATRYDRAQHRRYVRSLRSKRCPAQHWKRDAVLRACVRIEDHRNQHDRVAKQDRDHRLPPVHTGFDKTARERVGSEHNAHADPESGNVPGRPGSFFDCRWREIAIPEWTMGNVSFEFDEIVLAGAGFSYHMVTRCSNTCRASGIV